MELLFNLKINLKIINENVKIIKNLNTFKKLFKTNPW